MPSMHSSLMLQPLEMLCATVLTKMLTIYLLRLSSFSSHWNTRRKDYSISDGHWRFVLHLSMLLQNLVDLLWMSYAKSCGLPSGLLPSSGIQFRATVAGLPSVSAYDQPDSIRNIDIRPEHRWLREWTIEIIDIDTCHYRWVDYWMLYMCWRPDGTMTLFSRTVLAGRSTRKSDASSMTLCDQTFTRSSWRNT